MQVNLKKFTDYLISQSFVSKPSVVEKSAAVLLPLLKREHDWHLLFIRRAEVVGDLHSGQVAFPGGRLEINEIAEQAALREAEEEIALRASDVELLGRLEDFWSIGGYCVTPHIAMVPWPYTFQLQQTEVSHVFTIPVQWLIQKENFQIKSRQVDGQQRDVIYYREYAGEVLWGLTASIVLSFCKALTESQAV